MLSNAELDTRLARVSFLATDVDGVLTEGRITWGVEASGSLIELKSFSVKDGLGLGLARSIGITLAWITGRSSPIVEQRARELGIHEVVQRARDKKRVLESLADRYHLERTSILYIGDDLNDLPAFEVAGVRVAVADADAVVRQQADWVTAAPGGGGAVREVIDRLLRARGQWDEALRLFLALLAEEQGQ